MKLLFLTLTLLASMASAAGKFELFKGKNGQDFYFRLKAGNGQIILASQAYTTKAAAENGIKSVATNSVNEANFEKKESKNGKPMFNLKAANGQVIGTSEMYESIQARDNGIASVMKNAPHASILDTSGHGSVNDIRAALEKKPKAPQNRPMQSADGYKFKALRGEMATTLGACGPDTGNKNKDGGFKSYCENAKACKDDACCKKFWTVSESTEECDVCRYMQKTGGEKACGLPSKKGGSLVAGGTCHPEKCKPTLAAFAHAQEVYKEDNFVQGAAAKNKCGL